jgi:molybdate transport system ATP-binding protein
VTQLHACFRTRVGEFKLDVELSTPGTTVTGLFGPSGSGKTTLLRCVAGLHRAQEGSLRLNGDVWQDEKSGVFVQPHLRGIGYVSQDSDLFPHLSVHNNLMYAHRRAPREGRIVSWDDVVRWLEVESLLNRTVGNLSGGERQRVAVARALLTAPRLLLMDEPVSSLDEPARRDVLSYLEHVIQHISLPVIYVSHSLIEVARLADHLVWMVGGKVGDAGPVSEVLGRLDFARWRGEEPGVVLEGTVRDHDEEFQLTTVATPLGDLTIPRRPEASGTTMRVQISARDVSLGLSAQQGSSILNELQLSVLEVAEHSPSDCIIRLSGSGGADGPVLLARITHKSRAQLDLKQGSCVFARVKSVAVLD